MKFPMHLLSCLVAFYSAVCALTFLAFILREAKLENYHFVLDISIFKILVLTYQISVSSSTSPLLSSWYLFSPLLRGRYEVSPANVGLVALVMPLAMMMTFTCKRRTSIDKLKLKKNAWIVGNYAMIGVAVLWAWHTLYLAMHSPKTNFILLLITFDPVFVRSIFGA